MQRPLTVALRRAAPHGAARPHRTRLALIVLTGVAALALLAAAALLAPWSEREQAMIATVAGSGKPGLAIRSGPALELELLQPVDVAFDPDGNMYIAERFGAQVLMVDPSGEASVAAGLGESGFSGDGGPARAARLNGAAAIAADGERNLFISDRLNHRIRVVDASGTIRTFAGDGTAAFAGDGGPAAAASLNHPGGLAFDPDGNLYVADLGNDRIRRIDRQGVITTVAGTSQPGFSPDGTLAAAARLGLDTGHVPLGLAFDRSGALLFVDYGNWRVRSVDAEGRLRTVAGNGERGATGDGGPAVAASLEGPLDLAVDDDGTVYVSLHDHGGDLGGQRIRAIAPDGTITTLAGTGRSGFAGDHGPASAAHLNIPAGIAVGPDGHLYVADADNDVIRRIELG